MKYAWIKNEPSVIKKYGWVSFTEHLNDPLNYFGIFFMSPFASKNVIKSIWKADRFLDDKLYKKWLSSYFDLFEVVLVI